MEATIVPVAILITWYLASFIIHILFPRVFAFYAAAAFRFALLLGFMKMIDGRGFRWSLYNMGFKRPVIRPLLFGLIIAVPMLIGTIIFTIVSGGMVQPAPGWQYLIPFLIIGPGFFEEGLFRGYVFNHFYTYANFRWWAAALFAGLIFAFSHLINLFSGLTAVDILISMTFALPVSFLFGFMFLRMRMNIWGCLSAHVAIDVVTGGFVIAPGNTALRLIVLILSLAATIAVGFKLTKNQYPLERDVSRQAS